MLIGLPSFYGGFMTIYFGLTQHAGLAEDVLDHRLNAHRLYEPDLPLPLLEHELSRRTPHVSDGALSCAAALHEAIKADCPPPYPNTSPLIAKSFRAAAANARSRAIS
jgi:hypothetical protein